MRCDADGHDSNMLVVSRVPLDGGLPKASARPELAQHRSAAGDKHGRRDFR